MIKSAHYFSSFSKSFLSSEFCGHLRVTLLSERTPHITRGDWSPKIFKIAYYELVSSYLILPVRSYKFDTIRYVIKLKKILTHFRFMHHLKFRKKFVWYNLQMHIFILGGGHGSHFWHSRLSSVLKTHFRGSWDLSPTSLCDC